jgi:hypothetical protein
MADIILQYEQSLSSSSDDVDSKSCTTDTTDTTTTTTTLNGEVRRALKATRNNNENNIDPVKKITMQRRHSFHKRIPKARPAVKVHEKGGVEFVTLVWLVFVPALLSIWLWEYKLEQHQQQVNWPSSVDLAMDEPSGPRILE